ncbi:hypothetical protein AVEN_158898-1 [Araneus ventricosus]|uniref:Uncharacterized protein n=1 Tax=Araneus ventricosus TaxID=182803 RepID=A0A4Y2BBN2_ARAVE|nr:hypothetical protein AVEN_158898-1 [Araneus ventricosus]
MGKKYHLKATKASQFNTEKIPPQITGAYSTTPTAALQVIEGITLLHIKAQMESILVKSRIKIAKLISFLTDNEDLIKQFATSSSDSEPDFPPSPRPQIDGPDSLEVRYQGP